MLRTSQVWAHITDCEPSMVSCARSLQARFQWHGCVCHRLESTTRLVFNGAGVGDVMAKCRRIATYYSHSTQAVKRLQDYCAFKGMHYKSVKQDVATRWWSTYVSLESILHLRAAMARLLRGGEDDDLELEEENCNNL